MTRVTIAKAKDKQGIIPGSYTINLNGKPKLRVQGKRDATHRANLVRMSIKKRGRIPIGFR